MTGGDARLEEADPDAWVQPESDVQRGGAGRLVVSKLGDGLLGAVVIDQGFARGGGGDERRDGGVVQRTWQTQAAFMESSDGVIGKERIGAPDERQVVTQVSS